MATTPDNGEASSAQGAPGAAGDWHAVLDAGGEAPPAVDTAQLEAVLELSQEAPPGSSPGAPPAAAPGQASSGAASSPGAPPGAAAPGLERPGVWSRRKIERAKARELRAYVKELQERTPPPAPAPGELPPAGQAPEERLALLASALGPSFRVAGGMMAKLFRSQALEITEAESRTLAEVWAPLALPHYDDLVRGLPWAVAIGTTYEIGAPKIEAMARERRAAKLRQAAPADVLTVAPDAPGE